jgi:carboxyl-terminal processing protease
MDDFKDDASLKYTIGKRYSPNDENVDKIWIEPDITIEFDADLYTAERIDNQLEKAKTTIQELIK